jgi:riboflavin kinase/FMN adenylyltransferase
MQVHLGLDLLRPEWPGAVVCVGTYDGVHVGHCAVIGHAVEKALATERPCVVVTFDRHPAATLDPDHKPPAIRSLASNLARIEELGVGACVVLPFTKDLSQTSSDRFLRQLLLGRLHAETVVVGHDFGFGKGREGTVEWLSKRIDTVAVSPVLRDGVRVSSSEIRSAILSGDLERANTFLGKPFAIEGVVVGGQKLGRTLGYPTINLARSFDQAVPADGVYAGRAHTPRGTFKAALSIGFRPTVDGTHRTIEAYLLDYPGESLYGCPVMLEVHKRLRGEERFASLDDLKRQMDADVLATASVIQG